MPLVTFHLRALRNRNNSESASERESGGKGRKGKVVSHRSKRKCVRGWQGVKSRLPGVKKGLATCKLSLVWQSVYPLGFVDEGGRRGNRRDSSMARVG